MLSWTHRSVCTLEGLPGAFATLFPCCLPIQLFFIWSFRSHILPQNLLASFASCLIWLRIAHSPPKCWSNFLKCFRTSCFVYIVWSCFGIFLVFLLLLAFLVGLLKLFLSSTCPAFSVSSEKFICSVLVFSFFVVVFFICDSSLSSHQCFEFLSVVCKDTPFFSLTNFVPAYIKKFNSVISFVGKFVNKSCTFSVSNLIVLQSWFVSEGNVVFSSDTILLIE